LSWRRARRIEHFAASALSALPLLWAQPVRLAMNPSNLPPVATRRTLTNHFSLNTSETQ
jgi:hypothetical protein